MITLKGLIIREEPRGESSKSIYVLTAERGVISIFVRGGMKSGKNSASTQLYVYSELCLETKQNAKGETLYYLNSSEPQEMFYELRLDILKMSLAAYLSELLYFSRVEDASDINEVLRLTLNTFYFLNKGTKDRELLKSIFEFRLLCDTGLRPDLVACSKCYKYEDDRMHFNIRSGTLECEDCCENKDSMFGYVLDKKLLYILRHIALTDFNRLFAIRIAPELQVRLTAVTEGFVKYHFKERFKTLEFYRAL
ncbi:MAG: DNA repair protein RecO [Ruminococcus sp.]|nr:DNA repair protein RecO [Ruminococcus sp.]